MNRVGIRNIQAIGLLGAFGAVSLFSLSSKARKILVNHVKVISGGKITDPSIYFRFSVWAKVAESDIRNPFMPGGIGSDFDLKALGLRQKFHNVFPHNTMLLVFFKTGIIGVLPYLWLIALSLKRVNGFWHSSCRLCLQSRARPV